MVEFQCRWSDVQQETCPEKGGVMLVPELTNPQHTSTVLNDHLLSIRPQKAAISNKDNSSPAVAYTRKCQLFV